MRSLVLCFFYLVEAIQHPVAIKFFISYGVPYLLSILILAIHQTSQENVIYLVVSFISVAFADVYGYGFYPYEYLKPPTNITTSAEKQLAKMGMYSLRSFLYPKMFSFAMDIARWCYLPLTPFMVGRLSLKHTLTCCFSSEQFYLCCCIGTISFWLCLNDRHGN